MTNAELKELVQQQNAIIQQLQQQAKRPIKKKKEAGLGSVWRESTATVSASFESVGELAKAGRSLAQNARISAVISKAESAMEHADNLGIEYDTYEDAIEAVYSLAERLDQY